MLEWGNDDAPNNGRVALVTGAARGIGLGISAWLITEGWQVVLADVDRERGSKVARVLGDNAWFVAMDVAKEDQVSVGVAVNSIIVNQYVTHFNQCLITQAWGNIINRISLDVAVHARLQNRMHSMDPVDRVVRVFIT